LWDMEVSESPGYMRHVPSRVWGGVTSEERERREGKGERAERAERAEREGARERRREANMHRRGIGLDVSPYVCGYVGVSGIGMPMCSFS
jgi:hypothetical protein